MAKIEARMLDYVFVDAKNESVLVIPEEHEGVCRILGIANGREGFPDGSLLLTSHVKKLEKHAAKTESGTKYVLENVNEDYQDFVFAVHEYIPILEYWNIMKSLDTYYLTGICDGASSEGKIKEQEGNYLVLDDGRRYFVNWLNFSEEIRRRYAYGRPLIHGLDYPEDFEEFANFKCRPVLKLK